MNSDFTYLTRCCLCKSNDLKQIISLEETPPANELLVVKLNQTPKYQQKKFPLDVNQCQTCGHHQLSGEVDPERVFSNYVYVAGTSKINVKHFEDYSRHIYIKLGLQKSSKIFEIGSNDGTLLAFFQDLVFPTNVLGIDPAKNIAEQAKKNGINTINAFFNAEQAKNIIEYYGKFDVIVANNVLAHTSQLQDIVKGINLLLSEEGTLVFEVSYFLDVLENTLFDLIYNEHIHQHLLGPLIQFFAYNDLYLYDVERLPNHGGSIRAYVKKKYTTPTDALEKLLSQEKNINDKIKIFKHNLRKLDQELNLELEEIKSKGKSIACFGYAAKATTFLHEFNIGKYIDFIVDSNPLKQGLFSPGYNIPILHPDEIYKRNPDYLLILSWNFAESIMINHKNYNGSFIIPLPQLKIINNQK